LTCQAHVGVDDMRTGVQGVGRFKMPLDFSSSGQAGNLNKNFARDGGEQVTEDLLPLSPQLQIRRIGDVLNFTRRALLDLDNLLR
jgi:hypothetical protein